MEIIDKNKKNNNKNNNNNNNIKIGNITLENNVIVAPMAGVSDIGFRYINKKIANPGALVTEMVNSRAIYYEDKKTLEMLKTYENESPVIYQVFGDDEKYMYEAAKILSKKCDILDINMGCPAKKVVSTGAGSALMKDLDKARKIIRAVINGSEVPVTLKMRLGWDKENINCLELSKIAEEEGISLITIHGRTKTQMYQGKATYDEIKKVKEEVKIPVIVNGDIMDGKKAIEVLEYTKADGVMIARGAMGSPYNLKQIVDSVKNMKEAKKEMPKAEIVKDIVSKQYDMLTTNIGEKRASKDIRKHVIWFSSGFKNSKKIRAEVKNIVDKESLIKILDMLED